MPLTIEPVESKAKKLEKNGKEAAKIVVAEGWEVRPGRLLRSGEEVFVVRQQKEIEIIQEIVSLLKALRRYVTKNINSLNYIYTIKTTTNSHHKNENNVQ